MLLQSLHLKNYRSIDDSLPFSIDPKVTAFVGLNESGKTSVLQALHKALANDSKYKYSLEADFPRKRLAEHSRKKPVPPTVVAEMRFAFTTAEADDLAREFGKGAVSNGPLTLTHHYDGTPTKWSIDYDEKAAVAHIADSAPQIAGFRELIVEATTVREVVEKLRAASLEAAASVKRDELVTKFRADKEKGDLFWAALNARLRTLVPKTFYFDDYSILPAKVNLADLQQRKTNATMEEHHATIYALLEVAGVSIEELISPNGFESARARLEAISANITDRIFQFWKQNDQIEVEFHVSDDPKDSPPFNSGKNFYVRIKNNRHRVTMPLSNRSKGFIWFFSFLIWFDKIKADEGSAPILLLDEPGLNLHALAQRDLLIYLDHLAENHQVLYTTHSPFMVESAQLSRVRVVEDKLKEGTQVTSNVSASGRNTLFPLQAALGYTIAQNLFIRTKNLLVEGPTDLVLLKFFSAALEQTGRTGMRDDVAIVPVGGSAKIATFVALLHANDLEIVSLIDFAGKEDEHLKDLVKQKLMKDKQVLHYGQFRPAASNAPTDIEDLIPVSAYLDAFNATYQKTLSAPLVEADLPAGPRVVDRLTRLLADRKVTLRSSGGYNHFLVIQALIKLPTYIPDLSTLDLFESLFRKVNPLFGPQ